MAKYVEEYVLINGISQYFLHLPGTGKDVVIMLHGGPGLANSCIAYCQEPYFDFCNVVYYDQRGAGKTQLKNNSTPDSLSLDILLEDLKQTIEYVQQKYAGGSVFLLGHSWGTMLGTQYIIRYPQTVAGYIGHGQVVATATQDRSWYEHLKTLVLKSGDQKDIETFHSVNDTFPNIARQEFVKASFLLGELEYKYGFRANDVFEIYSKSPIWSTEDEIQLVQSEELNQKLYGEVFIGYDIRAITEYQTPVYYVLGRRDEWTTSTIAAGYFETIQAPKKGLYWIEDAGHLTDTDNPSAFFAAIKKIITQ